MIYHLIIKHQFKNYCSSHLIVDRWFATSTEAEEYGRELTKHLPWRANLLHIFGCEYRTDKTEEKKVWMEADQ